ncbi:MAG TPA: D-alanyl-D-alanine carboxypeptidase/D-alanyl-D-alanine-endopeptidase, partial [Calditrichae bacterium]|nr:D-alanyl-D-alanine carboxypeptidase/D-alanyl-D-alanine-endopeptidase [Calditrichia bacterium]
TVQEGILPDNARILVVHHSEPLSVVALHTNKPSNNLSAEMLCKTVGAEVYGVPGTWDKGLSAIRAYLDSLGIDSTTYEIVDGSGVSRYNLVFPHMLVILLRGISSDFEIEPEFTASLPIAGVDGSLQHRMKGTPAEGVLRAKTGTLSGVSALSGYTETADGERLAFSILMQHFVVPARNMRAIQDKIGALISGVRLRY